MQHDNSDDPFGFWKDEPTRQLKRAQAGTRAHADTRSDTRPITRMVPVIRTEKTNSVPALHPPRNPLVVRIGVMAGITLLLVPFALSLRDDQPRVRAANLQGVDTVLVGRMPAPAPTAIPETEASSTTLVPTPVPSPPSTEAIVPPFRGFNGGALVCALREERWGTNSHVYRHLYERGFASSFPNPITQISIFEPG